MIRPRALQATLGLLLVPLAAQACPEQSLSCIPRYHFALDQQTGAGFAVTRGDRDATQIGLGLGADFFPVENLSVGLRGGLGARREDRFSYPGEPDGWRVAWNVGGRVGYNIPFSRRWSVWTRIGLDFDNTPRLFVFSGHGGAPDPQILTYRTLSVDLFAPLVVHPNGHFFVGFGPYVSVPVLAYATNIENPLVDTSFGLKLLVGGHF